MNTKEVIIIIFISALITFSLRALPFVIFKGEKQLPKVLADLGVVLPSAIMAVLIVYCLKDVNENFWEDGIWKLIAVAIVALTYKWKHNTLISIVAGTAIYMILLRI